MKNRKRVANISLDLDNQWSYMKIHGDNGWEEYPSYFDIFVPHILEILEELDITITFFIVGKDAELLENRKYLEMIRDHGHEIGNHSYNHESWLESYSLEELEEEISTAEKFILEATGQKPVGFRGPGFSWSSDLLQVLMSKGYEFDASTLPTYIGPLARRYYFWKSGLSREERRERKELFGRFSDGFRDLKPYYWKFQNGNRLLEIPVTTIPIFKIPFHLSYLLYLNGISSFLMKTYLQIAITLCKLTNTPISFLLHPLDIIGGDQITQLAFFPGMDIPTNEKVSVFKYVLRKLKSNFELLPMNSYSTSARQSGSVKKTKIPVK